MLSLTYLPSLFQSPGQAALREGERLTAVLDVCQRMHVAAVYAWNERKRQVANGYADDRAKRHALKLAEREAVARQLALLDAEIALSEALAAGRARLAHGGGE